MEEFVSTLWSAFLAILASGLIIIFVVFMVGFLVTVTRNYRHKMANPYPQLYHAESILRKYADHIEGQTFWGNIKLEPSPDETKDIWLGELEGPEEARNYFRQWGIAPDPMKPAIRIGYPKFVFSAPGRRYRARKRKMTPVGSIQ